MKDLETKRTFIRKFKMEDANEAYENLGKNEFHMILCVFQCTKVL